MALNESQTSEETSLAEPATLGVNSGRDVGQALKAVRISKDLSLEAMAEETRIRRVYLAAIEDMAMHALPSRPFTIGYVRAYAAALGLDSEAAVARFKSDDPARDQGLREPVGVRRGGDPRLAAIILSGTLIVGAIILWNIAQRAMGQQGPPQSEVAPSTLPPAVFQGPMKLGAPLPVPVESTIPPPYETPGLQASVTNGGSVGAPNVPVEGAATPGLTLPETFVAQGNIYGVDRSRIILQARKSLSLVVRNPDGTPFFVRQLAAGEAYRVPTLVGISVEVVEAGAIQIYVEGIAQGLLPIGRTPVEKLAAPVE